MFKNPVYELGNVTAQNMKFSIKDCFSKCDQISRSHLRIWSHLLKKFLMENFIFCAVCNEQSDQNQRLPLLEICLNPDFFLVCIFPHSD